MAWCEENLSLSPALLVEEIAVGLPAGAGGGFGHRQAGPPLQGLPLCDFLHSWSRARWGVRQGGVDRGRGRSALHRDLVRRMVCAHAMAEATCGTIRLKLLSCELARAIQIRALLGLSLRQRMASGRHTPRETA